MTTPDYRDRLLTGITTRGGQRITPWSKVLTNTLAGSVNCLFQAAGYPEAGTYPGNVREANVITPGVVPGLFGGSSRIITPRYRHYLTSLEAMAPVANLNGVLMLGDLLCTYRGLPADSAAAQDLSTVGSAAGSSMLPRYTTGEGVRIFADVTTAFGATPVTLTVTYTNELGTSGRTSTNTTVANVPAGRSACVNSREPFSLALQSGDKGVRSLQTAQLSGTTGAAGVYTLFLYKPLAILRVWQYATSTSSNFGAWDSQGMDAFELLSGCVPILFWIPLTAVNDALYGHIKTVFVDKGR